MEKEDMMEQAETDRQGGELLQAVRNSIDDARDTVQKLNDLFRDNVHALRLSENEEVFTRLNQNIHELQYFMVFLDELKNGISLLKNDNLPPNPLLSGKEGFMVFQQMQEAFERNDWVMLSDLIEYELSPLLEREDEWLRDLDQKLGGIGA